MVVVVSRSHYSFGIAHRTPWVEWERIVVCLHIAVKQLFSCLWRRQFVWVHQHVHVEVVAIEIKVGIRDMQNAVQFQSFSPSMQSICSLRSRRIAAAWWSVG